MSPRRRQEFTLRNGMRLVADALGPDDGLPVVLLHGGGQTRGSWKGTLESLAAAGYHGIAIDARGHGESDYAESGDYTPHAMKVDLEDVVYHLGRAPVLVGASMGGAVALLLAGEGGSAKALGLVLVDIGARTNPEGVSRIQAFMRANPDGFASVEDAADKVSMFNPERPRPRDVSGLKRNLRLRNGRYFWHYDEVFLDSWVKGLDASAARIDAAARSLRMPTAIIHGARSDVLQQGEIDHFLALAPNSEYIRVSNANHMIVGDLNDAFNQSILGFLHRHFDPTAHRHSALRPRSET